MEQGLLLGTDWNRVRRNPHARQHDLPGSGREAVSARWSRGGGDQSGGPGRPHGSCCGPADRFRPSESRGAPLPSAGRRIRPDAHTDPPADGKRLGCRYWPNVRISTSWARRSSMTSSTSRRVSPRPSIRPDLVTARPFQPFGPGAAVPGFGGTGPGDAPSDTGAEPSRCCG